MGGDRKVASSRSVRATWWGSISTTKFKLEQMKKSTKPKQYAREMLSVNSACCTVTKSGVQLTRVQEGILHTSEPQL